MRLHGKSAVIYGANSPAGTSVARAFAKEGATVYLAGRSTDRLQPVAREILNLGGAVEVAKVDPLDPESVAEHLHQVVMKHGKVDVSLNLAFLAVEGATRLCNLTDEQFAASAFTRVRSNFVTTAAAVREMAYQGQGLVIATSAPEPTGKDGKMAGQIIGNAAIEALCDQMRSDVGSFGVKLAYLAAVPTSGEELVEMLLRLLTSIPATSPKRPEDYRGTSESGRFPSAEGPAGSAIV